MATPVSEFLSALERERKGLNGVAGVQLKSATARAGLRGLAEKYFASVRPGLTAHSSASDHRAAVDAAMTDLIALCHKQGSIAKYKALLKTAKAHLIHLDTDLVSAAQDESQPSDADRRIIQTLRALLPSAAAAYEQALFDLRQTTRLSWRGPATDLREALRETLDHLAPDDEVKLMPGYKQEQDTHGPTMKQKVRFILKHRGTPKPQTTTTEDATAAIDAALGSFVRSVYTRSSVSTHTATGKQEVLRIHELVRVVLGELLEAR